MTDEEGWTRFTLCAPTPAWTPGASTSPPWSSPPVAPSIVEARERLLALGLPDVRGAELRDVEVVVFDVWGQSTRHRERALVLPGPSDAPRFAVLGSGLAWPVHAMGPTLDVIGSCERALDFDREESIDGRDREHRDTGRQASDECAVRQAWPLLVDRGRADLVARANAGVTGSADDIVRAVLEAQLGALFERAITHYMQREDAVARADIAAISRVGPVARSLGSDADELAYLDECEVLGVELERRSLLGRRTPLEPREDEVVPASQIAALIDSLDEVDARQSGQPGGVSFAYDPRVAALIRAGEAAVPALIDCVASDRRLTRSVHFWRDFARHRSILGVHEACYTAVATILDADFFEIVATGDDLSSRGESGRRRVAAAIREHWERWGGIAPIERRWAVLSDDGATPAQWASAAEWLTDDAPTTHESTIQVEWVGRDDAAPMQGEPLRRDRGDALLAVLIARARSAQMSGAHRPFCSLLDAAITWAGDPAPPGILPIALACEGDDDCECRNWIAARLGHQSEPIATAWLAAMDDLFAGSQSDVEDVVSVLSDLLDVPAVARAADQHIRALRVDAAFVRHLAGDPSNRLEHVWTLALQLMPAAIDLLDRALGSTRRAATLEMHVDELGRARESYLVVRYRQGWWTTDLPEPFEAPRTVRACDLTARTLSRYLHVPFSLGWNDARRDTAIRDMRRRLEAMLREGWNPGAPDPVAPSQSGTVSITLP